MQQSDSVGQIKRKSVLGVISHSLRTFALQLIALVASLLLSGLLSPEEFGIFFTVQALVNLFVFLSDVGLAASLIQKKAEPTQADLQTTFTLQQVLALLIFGLIVGLTPLWQKLLGLDSQGLWLLYALGLSFPLASLKTIPSILLERELDFNRLVIPQIVENVAFYSVVVSMAWLDFGITSYTVGVLLRAVIGVIVLYWLKPWKPALRISRESINSLLKFGVPFQLNDLLARVKDDLLIVVMKMLLGSEAIGYLGWAKKWSLTPFRFTVDSIVRVTFPAFSRLQHDTEQLQRAIEKALFFIALIVFPLLLGMAGMAYPLTVLIPEYTKWQPALPALYWFIVDVMFSAMAVPIINALNALGRIKNTLRLMLLMTSMIWVLTLPMVKFFGFTGVAIATAGVAATSLLSLFILRRQIRISLLSNVLWQLLASIGMLSFLWLARDFASKSFINFICVFLSGCVMYAGLLGLLLRRRLLDEVYGIIYAVKNKQ